MMRTHPEWELKSKNNNLFRKLRYDWVRTKGGFWERVRKDSEKVAKLYKHQDSSMLEKARRDMRDVRKSVSEKNIQMLNTNSLREWKGSWRNPLSGNIIVTDAWRVYSEVIWGNMLSRETVFKEWLGCDLDIRFLLFYGGLDFINFWQSEVRAEDVPREWIRASIYGMQSEHRVTDGNPTDSSISTHAIDVDLIFSADKNFITMLNRIQCSAPFKTAYGILVQGGKPGVDELLDLLSNTKIVTINSNFGHISS